MLQSVTFLQPQWIVITFCIALFCVFLFLRSAKNYNFSATDALQKAYGNTSFWYYIFVILTVIISIVLWFLLSQTVGVSQWEKINKNGIDIQIVFDVSYSMIAQDIAPSRIEVAKKVVADFVSGLQTDRLGIILFAGKPFTSIPLTFDYDFIKEFLWDVSVRTINQDRPQLSGTAIGDALILWAKWLLQEEQTREKIIILLTDGEANRGIDPLIALGYLKEKNIKVYAIGVGKDDETFIQIVNDLWVIQDVQIGGIDEETLMKISQETWGKYYRADSTQALTNIFRDIWELEKQEIEVEQFSLYTPKDTHILIILLILSVLLGYFIFHKKIFFSWNI